MYPKLITLTLLMAVTDSSHAGESPTTISTLPEAIQAGLLNHPGLKAMSLEWQSELQQVDVAAALPDPRLEARNELDSRMIGVAQEIPMMGKLRLRGEIAGAEAAAARRLYEAERLETIREIAGAWFDHAWSRRRYELLEELGGFLKADREITLERVRSGGSQTDTLRLDIELGKVNDELREAERDLAVSRAELAQAIGVDAARIGKPTLEMAWAREFEQPDADPSDHPVIQALEARVAAAEARETLAFRNKVPDPMFGLSAMEMKESGDTGVGVMVGFNLPIWGKKNRAERAAAVAEAEAARARVTEGRNELTEQVAVSREALQLALNRAARYRQDLIPDAENVRAVLLTEYGAGEASIRDLVEIEAEVLELKQVWWRAVADAGRNLIFLQTWAGEEPLTDGGMTK